MYRYETHLHTAPVSKCAKATVRENLEFYKSLGFAGVFITNHFIDGNMSLPKTEPYEARINYHFSDYEEALMIGKELGIRVFAGIETTFKGTDFLVYGLDKSWFLSHPEILDMDKSQQLTLYRDSGALIIQAHPFHEASYIDHIRLFPRHIHGVETYNACRSDFQNQLAAAYASAYGLLPFAGSDNHKAGNLRRFGGMQTETPIIDEADFIRRVLNGEAVPFQFSISE